jgi:hypothetical protein
MNLQKGDFITVVKWKDCQDNSYKGDCLEVKVIDGDFILVKNHTKSFYDKNITLDMRRVEVRRLSREYVEDCIPHLKTKNPFRAVAVS